MDFLDFIRKVARERKEREYITKGGKGSGWFGPPKGTHTKRVGGKGRTKGQSERPESFPKVKGDSIEPSLLRWTGGRTDGFIKGGKEYRFFHATAGDKLSSIEKNGLKAPEHTRAKWYMTTSSYESAKTFATSKNPVILEYRLPSNKVKEYLWKGDAIAAYGDIQHGIRKPIPKKYLHGTW